MGYRPLMRLTFWMAFLLSLSSCATLLNGPNTKVKIHTEEKAKIIVPQREVVSRKKTLTTPEQRLVTHDNLVIMPVSRSPDPLKFSVIGDSLTKEVSVPAGNSVAFLANLLYAYGLGVLVDWNNPRRCTYPKNIYVYLNDERISYLLYDRNALNASFGIVKVTPLKLFGISNPGLEIAIEKATGQKFSTQVMGSALLPYSVWEIGINSPSDKGFRTAVEERYYLEKEAPLGNYVALELDYMWKQTWDSWLFIPKEMRNDTVSHRYEDYTSEQYRVDKQTFSINLKLGYQFARGRYTFDTYLGMGLRYKDVKHINKTSKDVVQVRDRIDFNFMDVSNKEGRYWTLSLPFNFRFGYYF